MRALRPLCRQSKFSCYFATSLGKVACVQWKIYDLTSICYDFNLKVQKRRTVQRNISMLKGESGKLICVNLCKARPQMHVNCLLFSGPKFISYVGLRVPLRIPRNRLLSFQLHSGTLMYHILHIWFLNHIPSNEISLTILSYFKAVTIDGVWIGYCIVTYLVTEMGFGLVIGFIKHSQVVTTITYNYL
jgi:hypothetical protein